MFNGGCVAASASNVADRQVQEEDGISARSDGDEDARKGEPGCTDRGPQGDGGYGVSSDRCHLYKSERTSGGNLMTNECTTPIFIVLGWSESFA